MENDGKTVPSAEGKSGDGQPRQGGQHASAEPKTKAGSAEADKQRPSRPEKTSGGKPVTMKKNAPPKKKKSWVGKLFLLLVLALLGAGGYYAYQQGYSWTELRADWQAVTGRAADSQGSPDSRNEIPDNSEIGDSAALNPDNDQGEAIPPVVENTLSEEEVAGLIGSATENLEQADIAQSDKIARLEKQIADLQLQFNEQRQRLRELSTTSREDWLLAEAEYLIRLADQRLLTERRTGNALALLVAADDILKEIDDTDLFPVRKALAADITAVKMAGVVDREGLFVRLESLINEVDRLEIPIEPQAQADKDVLPSTDSWYRQLWHNIKQAAIKMSGVVRAEKLEMPKGPPLLPAEQEVLRHNLRMNLEQAQLSLMREEQSLYQSSLSRALKLVESNFSQSKAASVFEDEISQLQMQDITQSLPPLSRSINALQDYIRLWHDTYSPGDDQQTEPAVQKAQGATP